MSAREDFIYFGCPRCTAPLKAPAAHARRRQRCPLCYTALDVPPHSRRTDVEQYELHDDSLPAVEARPTIAVDCPLCHTRMTAPEDQVGQEIACPDCGTRVRVPSPPAPRPRKRLVPLQEYALCEDYDPAAAAAAQPRYLPVYCGRCHTLMHATADQVGGTLTCPDCNMETVVPAPAAARERPWETSPSTYGIHEELGQPPPGSVASQEHVGFLCTCGTRLSATVAEAGREIVCPDCGRSVTVPPPKAKRPKPDMEKEIDGQYEVAARQEAPPPPPPAFRAPWVLAARAEGRVTGDPPPPPRRPLVSGVFQFPWYRTSVGHWLSLSVGGMVIVYLAWIGSYLGGFFGAGAGMAALAPVALGLTLTALTCCLAAGWAGIACVNLLAILWDTAAGNDDVVNWPDTYDFLDWLPWTFFVFNSGALAALAGAGVAWLLDRCGLPSGLAAFGTSLAAFPLVLLSMLERNTALMPFSPAILRSLLRHWRAWAGFYLETTLVLIAAGALLVVTLLPGRPALAIPPAMLVFMAALMIYFRLLGRLAWCGSLPGPGDVVR